MWVMTIEVASSALDTMVRETENALSRECCGILLGHENRIESARPTANVHPEPKRQFEIDPQALFDAFRAARNGGPQVLGYYHSHPVGEAKPSATDQERALRDGSIWAIVAGDGLRLWHDAESGFAELSYRVIAA